MRSSPLVRQRRRRARQRAMRDLRAGARGARPSRTGARSRRCGRCGAGGCSRPWTRQRSSAARLRIDERVLHYLAGVNYLDPRLQPLLRPASRRRRRWPRRSAARPTTSPLRSITQACAAYRWSSSPATMRTASATSRPRVGRALGLRLHRARGRGHPREPARARSARRAVGARGRAARRALLIECDDGGRRRRGTRLVDRIARPGLRRRARAGPPSSRRDAALSRSTSPIAADQKRLWRRSARRPAPRRLNGALDGVAAAVPAERPRPSAAGAARVYARDRGSAGCGAVGGLPRRSSGAVSTTLAQRIDAGRRAGTTWCCPSRRSRRCGRSPRTCATGSRSTSGGASPGRARAASASARCSPARAAPARRWPPRCSRTSCISISTASTSPRS